MLSKEDVLKRLEKLFMNEEIALTERVFSCSIEQVPACRAQRSFLLSLWRKVSYTIEKMEEN